MKYAYFGGCNIPYQMPETNAAIHALMGAFSIELADLREFTCCGYPVKKLNTRAWLTAAARNLALAEKKQMGIATLCACCYHSLRMARDRLARDSAMADEVNKVLAQEKLEYRGRVRVEHALAVIGGAAGPDGIAGKVVRPMEGLKAACHYGCHLLRPSNVMGFDDPFVPAILDEMAAAAGAAPIEWDRKMDCCGAPVLGADRDLALKLARGKLESAANSGADILCTVCPFCHLFFEDVLKTQSASPGNAPYPALMNYAVLFCQALGLKI